MNPGGVATDSADNLWVGNLNGGVLDEFEPAYPIAGGKGENKLGSLAPFKAGAVEPGNVAIESSTLGNGDFYVTNPERAKSPVEVFEPNGTHQESWREFENPDVAIESSLSGCGAISKECAVFVGEDGGIVKLNSKGVEGSFEASESYISGATITGAPVSGCGESFEGVAGRSDLPLSVAVDAQGEIFVAVPACQRVFEYLPSGKYERELNMENPEVPRINEAIVTPHRLAVDSVGGNLLVSVQAGNHVSIGAIYEFDIETGKFVSEITQAGEGKTIEEPRELAVDALGDVYLVDAKRHVVDVWSPLGPPTPTVKLGAVSARTETSAVLNGSVDPEGNPLGECRFQWVSEAAFTKEGFKSPESAECEPEAKAIPANDVPTGVTGKATGLTAGTTYDYRLLAKTEGGGEAQSEPLAFTALAKPGIVSTYAENLSSTFADLHAQIKPNGATTSYFFEYLPEAQFQAGGGTFAGARSTPEVDIGAGGPTGGSVESVLQPVGGLTAGTTYRFRVVAVSAPTGKIEDFDGPEVTFATLPAAVSSERGYELVTPADKQGGSDMFAQPSGNGVIENSLDVGVPADNGEGFLLNTKSGFGEFPFAFSDQYVFKRVKNAQTGQLEWSYTSLASPSLGVQSASGEVAPAAADLSRVTLDDGVGSTAGGEGGVRVMSLIGPPGGSYLTLHTDAPFYTGHEKSVTESTLIVGGSESLSHVILESHSAGICPGAENVKHGAVLCEWSGGELQLVNTAPGNETAPTSECGATLGIGNQVGKAHGAVSQDGSRVLFTAPGATTQNEGPGCWNGAPNIKGEGVPVNAPQLYARVETGEGAHEVLKVSEPEEAVRKEEPLRYPAVYVGASTDGSKVFFLTKTWMTQNHPEGHDAELYEWEAEGSTSAAGTCAQSSPNYVALSKGCLTRVSAGEAGMEREKDGARVQFVSAVSADGANVYFTAFDVLAPHATRYPVVNQGDGEHPVDLYRYDTETRRTSYVAAVDTSDYEIQSECATSIKVETGVEGNSGLCTGANWYTTPDGRYLLFGASLEVEGYNKVADGCAEEILPHTQGVRDGRCSELYRYDAGAAERGEQAIVCVSCGSGEADAAGNAQFARSDPGGPATGAVRAMSNNGEYVFFDSQASLVSAASNGTLDTYQWREDLATHERSISLVGSGTDTAPTFFLGYAPNPAAHTVQAREAGNVFIGTHAKLSPVQTNSVGNIYDARACEPGSPCIKPPLGETAQCLGGECQKPPPAPPDPVATLLAPPAAATLAPPPPAKKTAAQIKAEDLAKALKKCKADKSKKKRRTCEASAQKKYGATKAKKKAKKSDHGRAK